MSNTEQQYIKTLITDAISVDLNTNNPGGGFLTVMAEKNKEIAKDIPAAYEMYTLLEHWMSRVEFKVGSLLATELAPSVTYDPETKKVLALMNIESDELGLVAHWISDSLQSIKVKEMPGLLALPFSIESHNDIETLIPEAYAAYYVDSMTNHCIPMLTLKSVLLDDRTGDWTNVAYERLSTFGLPIKAAKEASTVDFQFN